MVKKFFILWILLSCLSLCYAQTLKPGDFLFQNLDCGALCDAIESVTHGRENLKFSHIGMVVKQADSLLIIEAIGEKVCYTSLYHFCKRNNNAIYLGRPNLPDSALLKITNYAQQQINTPYDDAFIYNNGKYYCSELFYDAFLKTGYPILQLEPMTFKEPGKDIYFKAWINYYKKLNMPIPEGKPGINPAGISRCENLTWLGIYQYKSW